MKSSGARFPADVVDLFRKSKIIGIRVGASNHRFIGLWAVVVGHHVYVRSWSVSPGGWYSMLRQARQGEVQVADKQMRFRAILTRSERLKDEVTRAYRDKYNTPGAQNYVRDFSRSKCRAATVELVPA